VVCVVGNDTKKENARSESGASPQMVDQAQRFGSTMRDIYMNNRHRNFKSKSFRVIPQTPERILDAPELLVCSV